MMELTQGSTGTGNYKVSREITDQNYNSKLFGNN